MDESHFWKFLEDSIHDIATKDKAKLDDIATGLMSRLEQLEAPEVREFGAEYEKRMQALYRWDLWAIATIIHGGCSDDGFEDFRNWIIFQGKDFYLKSKEHPAYIAEITEEGKRCKFEPYIYFQIRKLYESKSGLRYEGSLNGSEDPVGKKWTNYNDLWDLYPDICEKFSCPE
jgi:hypothetical protein